MAVNGEQSPVNSDEATRGAPVPFTVHRSRFTLSYIGALLLAFVFCVAFFAPFIAPYDPHARVARPFTTPNAQYWLGTNDIGQDILSELIFGTRISLLVGVAAASLSVLVSTSVGLVAGYAGGALDALLMRVVDLILVFPFLPLMIVIAAYLGQGLVTELLVISALLWAGSARIIRAQVLATKALPFIESGRAVGVATPRILLRYLLPALVPLMIAQLVRTVNVAILLEASLSFLGLGDPVQKSWGTMLYYANVRGAYLTGAWQWWIVPPGLCIAAVVLGFAFVGLSLEERANPRLRH